MGMMICGRRTERKRAGRRCARELGRVFKAGREDTPVFWDWRGNGTLVSLFYNDVPHEKTAVGACCVAAHRGISESLNPSLPTLCSKPHRGSAKQ